MNLFVLAIEPLANVYGDKIGGSIRFACPNQLPKLASQYCDVTCIISTRIEDWEVIRELTAIFEAGAGAVLNCQKTEILLVGDLNEAERSGKKARTGTEPERKCEDLGCVFWSAINGTKHGTHAVKN